MEWVKTTAKTLPEAIDLALDNLGVDESEAEIVVLEEPRAGLFGRTRGIARVEARVKPKPTRAKVERGRGRRSEGSKGNRNRGGSGRDRSSGGNKSRDGKGRDGARSGGGSDSGRSKAKSDKQANGDRNTTAVADATSGPETGNGEGPKKKRSRNRRKSGAQRGTGGNVDNAGGNVESAGGNVDSAGGSNSADGASGRDQKDGRRSDGEGDRGGGGRSRSKSGGRAKSSSGATKKSEAAVSEQGASVEEVASHLEGFLRDLTEAFGVDSEVSIDHNQKDDGVTGNIDEAIGLLVGPKGRTLDAVQELARVSCQRAVPSNVRIKVDVGGYRVKRAEALGKFAEAAADRAVSEGIEVALEPMSAADRKAVHDSLTDDDRVSTRSVGVDPRRRILVVPNEQDEEAIDEDE